MAVKLRLQRRGRTKAPFYHIVAADARAPRDGRFIEKIGTYNPITVPATIELNRDRAYYWLTVGAQPTDTVNAILGFKGVLYKKHLQLGVKKGALTQEEADEKLSAWIEQKEASIAKRREKVAADKLSHAAIADGSPKVRTKAAPPLPVIENAEGDDTVVEAAAETTEAVVEAAAETTEAVAEAAAETTEAVVEAAAETTEAVVEAAAETTEAVVEAAAETTEAEEKPEVEAKTADKE